MPTQGASFLLRPILDRFDCCLLAGKITGPRIGEMAERFVQYTAQAAEENAAFPLRADKSSPLKRHPPLRECIGSSSMQSSFLPRKGVSYVASRSEEHTSELQSLMRISYAVFCLKQKKQ